MSKTASQLRIEADTITSMRRDMPGYGTSPIFLREAADELDGLYAQVNDLQHTVTERDSLAALVHQGGKKERRKYQAASDLIQRIKKVLRDG